MQRLLYKVRSSIQRGRESRTSIQIVTLDPPAQDKVTIFTFDRPKNKFKISEALSSHSKAMITEQEAAQFFLYIEEELSRWSKSTGDRVITVFKIIPLLLAITAIIGIPLSAIHTPAGKFPIIIPIIFALIIVAFMLLFGVTHIYSVKSGKKLKEATDNVRAYIEQKNALYKLRHLSWTIPQAFPWWVELWRETPKGVEVQSSLLSAAPSNLQITFSDISSSPIKAGKLPAKTRMMLPQPSLFNFNENDEYEQDAAKSVSMRSNGSPNRLLISPELGNVPLGLRMESPVLLRSPTFNNTPMSNNFSPKKENDKQYNAKSDDIVGIADS